MKYSISLWCFIAGFLTNSVLQRVSGNVSNEDIIYPRTLLYLVIVIIVLQLIKERI